MPRRKKKEVADNYNSLLSDKDILLAYCSTLSEARCRRAYQLLKLEFNTDNTRMIKLNKHGVQDDRGLLRMHTKQFDKCLEEFGKDMFNWLIERMYRYVENLTTRAERGETRAKSKLKEYTLQSIYPHLHDNWILDEYYKALGEQEQANRIDFYSIKTEEDALKYVQDIPPEYLDGYTGELEHLTARYPKVLEYIRR